MNTWSLRPDLVGRMLSVHPLPPSWGTAASLGHHCVIRALFLQNDLYLFQTDLGLSHPHDSAVIPASPFSFQQELPPPITGVGKGLAPQIKVAISKPCLILPSVREQQTSQDSCHQANQKVKRTQLEGERHFENTLFCFPAWQWRRHTFSTIQVSGRKFWQEAVDRYLTFHLGQRYSKLQLTR